MADTVFEAELLGHVRGAFTGADRACGGLFVEADGGTLLFNEVGEIRSACKRSSLVPPSRAQGGRLLKARIAARERR